MHLFTNRWLLTRIQGLLRFLLDTSTPIRISGPACYFDADPDPARHFDADPDPSFQLKAQNLEVLREAHIQHILPCHLEIDAVPVPANHFDAIPDSTEWKSSLFDFYKITTARHAKLLLLTRKILGWSQLPSITRTGDFSIADKLQPFLSLARLKYIYGRRKLGKKLHKQVQFKSL